MSLTMSDLIQLVLKAGAFLMLANEIRGAVVAAPVFVMMYEAGGTWMAVWLGFSLLGGIAVSVVVPLAAFKRLAAAAG